MMRKVNKGGKRGRGVPQEANKATTYHVKQKAMITTHNQTYVSVIGPKTLNKERGYGCGRGSDLVHHFRYDIIGQHWPSDQIGV